VALFYYQALTSEDKTIEGQMEAASEHAVISKLQEMGYFPVSTQTVTEQTSGRKRLFRKELSQADILLFTQKLAVMLKAGLTLDAALALLIETADSDKLKTVLEKVSVSIHNGMALSDALQQSSATFDRFYMNTLRAGETAGSLDVVLARLATHLEHNHAVKKSVQSALIYPAVLVAVASVTLLILLVYVVPQFQALFEDMGQALPLPTQIVIAIADGIKHYGWIALIALFGLSMLIKRTLCDTKKRMPIDKMILRLPLVADMVIRLEVGRFSRTLATLLNNGVPMLSALAVVASSLNNTVIRQAINNVKDSVHEGRGVAIALRKQAIFPPMAVQLIRVGEETGELVPMLEQVADIYDEELRDSIQRFLTLLEPLLIIGLGIIIAGIIISVLLAILSLNDFAV
jgi:general secretion pathway protein F